jgi:hypothetical protein
MNGDREFFADVCQRLAAGQQLLTYHFPNRFFLPDKHSGLMLLRGEDGIEFQVGPCFPAALNEYIRAHHLAWCIGIIEQTLTLGPGIKKLGFSYQWAYGLPPE